MRKLLVLVFATGLSVVLYALVFSYVQRPLTLGDLTRQLDFKMAVAARTAAPKIMVFAGSNGRYSHRCAEIAEAVGLPCVNAAIAAGIGIDFLLDQYASALGKGDIVYMPLEYDQYNTSEKEMHSGVQNAVMLLSRPKYLWSLPPARITQVYAAFDFPFLIRGVAEMGLARSDFKRRTGIETLTPEGDEQGHTPQKGAVYARYLAQAPAPRTSILAGSYAQEVLRRFLVDAKHRGIIVYGGLPTVPDTTSLEAADIDRIRLLFESTGQRFVALPQLSRYPIGCFYDGPYHLNEDCQREHSRAVGRMLGRLAAPH